MVALSLLFLGSFHCGAQDLTHDEALARQITRSVDLFTTYTGSWPRRLEDLVEKPKDVRFWPEGGFWLGPLPKGVLWNEGNVTVGTTRSPVSPPPWSPIVPPTDRLREQYTALVRLQLLRSAVQAVLDAQGKLPPAPIDGGTLPRDPWGKPFSFQMVKGRVRLSVQDAPAHALSLSMLTTEEIRDLDRGGRVEVPESGLQAIRALVGQLADDDFDTRKEAREKLRAWGAAARQIIRDRLGQEKDPEVRHRLAEVSVDFPERPPSWRSELRPLVAVVLGEHKPGAETQCSNNLSQLWKMQVVYMSQFGGRMKKMPEATGKEFWLALARTEPPLIDETALEIFVCPVSGDPAAKGVCTYAGPAENVAKMGSEDAVGLCEDEGHGDVVILLLKSGDVDVVPRDGPEHESAKKKTKR
jgi:hypothetical protein